MLAEDARDQRVYLHQVTWEQYEYLRNIRGESAVPRLSFLDGELELMSPCGGHARTSKTLARLLEAYAVEAKIFCNGYGSMTLCNASERRGLEPDECYAIGVDKEVPDLAIEVFWSAEGQQGQEGIHRREIYFGLGVGELWEYASGRIDVMTLDKTGYRLGQSSRFFPALDLVQLASFVGRADQTEAVRAYRRALHGN